MSAEWAEQCQERTREVLRHKGWKLATDFKAFARQVEARVAERLAAGAQPDRMDKIVDDAVTYCYCHLLHEACCQSEDTARRDRALTEIWEYLYGYAFHFYARGDEDLAEECAQRALVKVWQQSHTCDQPGYFLKWASVIAYHEWCQIWRKPYRKREMPLYSQDEELEEGLSEAELSSFIESRWQPEPLAMAATNGPADRARLISAIQQCLKRSASRQAVIIEHYLNGKDFNTIADLLETSVNNVHLLHHRAIASLRECPEVLELLCELIGA